MSKILQPHNLPLNQPLRLPNGNVLRNRLPIICSKAFTRL